jgi:hypothetical protein
MLIERKDLFTGETYYVDQDDIPGRFGISFNDLKELVECCPEEGWAKYKSNKYSRRGKLEVSAGERLSRSVTINNNGVKLSHLIWVFARDGIWTKDELDHIDGDVDNNKISNLREATRSQNIMNRNIHSDNTSGYPGIRYKNHKWRADIWFNGEYMHLGYFDTFEAALAARQAAEDKYWGEFAARHSRPQRPPGPDLFAAPEDSCDAALIWATTDCTRYGAKQSKPF